MTIRIKGQEVTTTYSTPTGPSEGLDFMESCEFEIQIELLRQGYLGQTADEKDEIYRGVSGKSDCHMANAGFFRFAQLVQQRAQRRSPANGKFNLTCSFAFPDTGERARITFEDLKFGPLPVRAQGRDAYVAASISWECTTFRVQV